MVRPRAQHTRKTARQPGRRTTRVVACSYREELAYKQPGNIPSRAFGPSGEDSVRTHQLIRANGTRIWRQRACRKLICPRCRVPADTSIIQYKKLPLSPNLEGFHTKSV